MMRTRYALCVVLILAWERSTALNARIHYRQVRKDLKDLGKTIQEDLREQQHLQTTQRPAVPTQDQIDQMICRNVLTREQEQTYDNFKMADVISGAPPHLKLNRELMEFAQKNFYITPIKEPFQQVVLVTNKGKQI
jgi:hypothetical protein